MSLLVHYQNLKHFDADKCQWLGEKGQNAIDQKKTSGHSRLVNDVNWSL